MINGFTNLTNEEMFNINAGQDADVKTTIWSVIITGLVMGLANYADYMTYMNSLSTGDGGAGYIDTLVNNYINPTMSDYSYENSVMS